MNLIQNINVQDKTVILRCDLNVTIKDGHIQSDEKIKASLETINYLVEKNAKIIIISHLGRVKTEEDKAGNSLRPVFNRLKELINHQISFCETTHGEELENMIKNLNNCEIILVENIRFEDVPDKKESSCSEELTNYWANLGDVFIYDAFGVAHRRHALIYGLFMKMPSAVGFLVQKELEGLAPLMNPDAPFVVLMSGAKLADKIILIESLLKKCDYLLIGGGIANTFLSLKHDMGQSLVSYDSIEEVQALMAEYSDKIIMPDDVVIGSGEIKQVDNINIDESAFDIGPKTIKKYADYINKGRTIFINGTVGMYEDDRYANGTKEILTICSNASGKTIVGGGDALASAQKFNIEGFDFISTGGGVTLDYIGTGKIAGLEE